MTAYKDLTQNQQLLFDKIEWIFMNQVSISRHDFIMVLGVLINKHKIKIEKEEKEGN